MNTQLSPNVLEQIESLPPEFHSKMKNWFEKLDELSPKQIAHDLLKFKKEKATAQIEYLVYLQLDREVLKDIQNFLLFAQLDESLKTQGERWLEEPKKRGVNTTAQLLFELNKREKKEARVIETMIRQQLGKSIYDVEQAIEQLKKDEQLNRFSHQSPAGRRAKDWLENPKKRDVKTTSQLLFELDKSEDKETRAVKKLITQQLDDSTRKTVDQIVKQLEQFDQIKREFPVLQEPIKELKEHIIFKRGENVNIEKIAQLFFELEQIIINDGREIKVRNMVDDAIDQTLNSSDKKQVKERVEQLKTLKDLPQALQKRAKECFKQNHEQVDVETTAQLIADLRQMEEASDEKAISAAEKSIALIYQQVDSFVKNKVDNRTAQAQVSSFIKNEVDNRATQIERAILVNRLPEKWQSLMRDGLDSLPNDHEKVAQIVFELKAGEKIEAVRKAANYLVAQDDAIKERVLEKELVSQFKSLTTRLEEARNNVEKRDFKKMVQDVLEVRKHGGKEALLAEHLIYHCLDSLDRKKLLEKLNETTANPLLKKQEEKIAKKPLFSWLINAHPNIELASGKNDLINSIDIKDVLGKLQKLNVFDTITPEGKMAIDHIITMSLTDIDQQNLTSLIFILRNSSEAQRVKEVEAFVYSKLSPWKREDVQQRLTALEALYVLPEPLEKEAAELMKKMKKKEYPIRRDIVSFWFKLVNSQMKINDIEKIKPAMSLMAAKDILGDVYKEAAQLEMSERMEVKERLTKTVDYLKQIKEVGSDELKDRLVAWGISDRKNKEAYVAQSADLALALEYLSPDLSETLRKRGKNLIEKNISKEYQAEFFERLREKKQERIISADFRKDGEESEKAVRRLVERLKQAEVKPAVAAYLNVKEKHAEKFNENKMAILRIAEKQLTEREQKEFLNQYLSERLLRKFPNSQEKRNYFQSLAALKQIEQQGFIKQLVGIDSIIEGKKSKRNKLMIRLNPITQEEIAQLKKIFEIQEMNELRALLHTFCEQRPERKRQLKNYAYTKLRRTLNEEQRKEFEKLEEYEKKQAVEKQKVMNKEKNVKDLKEVLYQGAEKDEKVKSKIDALFDGEKLDVNEAVQRFSELSAIARQNMIAHKNTHQKGEPISHLLHEKEIRKKLKEQLKKIKSKEIKDSKDKLRQKIEQKGISHQLGVPISYYDKIIKKMLSRHFTPFEKKQFNIKVEAVLLKEQLKEIDHEKADQFNTLYQNVNKMEPKLAALRYARLFYARPNVVQNKEESMVKSVIEEKMKQSALRILVNQIEQPDRKRFYENVQRLLKTKYFNLAQEQPLALVKDEKNISPSLRSLSAVTEEARKKTQDDQQKKQVAPAKRPFRDREDGVI